MGSRTTDELIDKYKDMLDNDYNSYDDSIAIAETLERLVNIKRMEQITEQEADNNG